MDANFFVIIFLLLIIFFDPAFLRCHNLLLLSLNRLLNLRLHYRLSGCYRVSLRHYAHVYLRDTCLSQTSCGYHGEVDLRKLGDLHVKEIIVCEETFVENFLEITIAH